MYDFERFRNSEEEEEEPTTYIVECQNTTQLPTGWVPITFYFEWDCIHKGTGEIVEYRWSLQKEGREIHWQLFRTVQTYVPERAWGNAIAQIIAFGANPTFDQECMVFDICRGNKPKRRNQVRTITLEPYNCLMDKTELSVPSDPELVESGTVHHALSLSNREFLDWLRAFMRRVITRHSNKAMHAFEERNYSL
jgi:hypothetical protein